MPRNLFVNPIKGDFNQPSSLNEQKQNFLENFEQQTLIWLRTVCRLVPVERSEQFRRSVEFRQKCTSRVARMSLVSRVLSRLGHSSSTLQSVSHLSQATQRFSSGLRNAHPTTRDVCTSLSVSSVSALRTVANITSILRAS